MTIKLITLQMSERSFTTLFNAIHYAFNQLEGDMEKATDPEFATERAQLAHLAAELATARQTVIAKGANV